MKAKDAIATLSKMNPESELGTTDSDIGEFLITGFNESTYDDEDGTHDYIEVDMMAWQ